jgi:hypothetical protein
MRANVGVLESVEAAVIFSTILIPKVCDHEKMFKKCKKYIDLSLTP